MLLGMRVQSFALLRSAHWGVCKEDLQKDREPERDPHAVWSHIPLQPLTALMGPNNSGKSAWFSCLRFFCDCLQYGVTRASTLEGGGGFSLLQSSGSQEPMEMEFLFSLQIESRQPLYSYSLQICPNQQGKPQITREELLRFQPQHPGEMGRFTPPFSWRKGSWTSLLCRDREQLIVSPAVTSQSRVANSNPMGSTKADEDVPAISLLGRLGISPEWTQVYDYFTHWYLLSLDELSKRPHASSLHVQTQSQLLTQGTGTHRHIDSNGSNLTNVLQHIRKEHPEAFTALVERLGHQIPLTRQFYQELARGAGRSADVRLFLQYLLFADPSPRPLVYLDLPETGLYPERLHLLAQEMRRYSLLSGTQLLLNTHSSVLLESMNPLEIWQVQTVGDEEATDRADFWSLEGLAALEVLEAEGRSATVHCVGENPLVRSLYREGVGMGALWYSGYLGATE